LLSNAHQALQNHGGEIVITTRMNGSQVQVSFADDGPGVPPELRSRVFEPFFTTREVGSGQGMGLSIVYGVVTNHGGRTWVEASSPGATFVIELPIGSGERRTETTRPPAEETEPARHRILVVDDEATVRA